VGQDCPERLLEPLLEALSELGQLFRTGVEKELQRQVQGLAASRQEMAPRVPIEPGLRFGVEQLDGLA
jgi:hypothetical protein